MKPKTIKTQFDHMIVSFPPQIFCTVSTVMLCSVKMFALFFFSVSVSNNTLLVILSPYSSPVVDGLVNL
jgi:hypothetical protein